MTDPPRYLPELHRYVEENLDKPICLLAALSALLTDPEAYVASKGQPSGTLVDFVEELVLRNRPLREFLRDPSTPISRALIDQRWSTVWREARSDSKPSPLPEYDVCISFAGPDRPIAKEIADAIASNGMNRKVFYDEFEETTLWGEDLYNYLYETYSKRSKFCMILFSHAYRQRAWTRHELRAAQTRVLEEQQAYVLPVALEQGAVPDEFASIGYWSFKPGDESRIAEATEEKINDYIGEHYFSIELISDMLRRDSATSAVLDAFKLAIKHKSDASDETGVQVLTLIALIAATDMENARRSVRAIVDLILFTAGPVDEAFGDEDRLLVAGSASVRRWLGKHGPLLLSAEGWDGFIEPYRQHWESLSGDEEPEDDDSESDSNGA
ncbi:TIR domain-containing protein [Plantactinospora sp. S1510]|uniref:TIR domain-containing protein n=1 Tax=Plantactinospora alkalitolerans TaxID=2789879 RepID=A0ABS0H8H5_9ACTN|nr:TIR domain-containing protein [Plantactinospora alkalitolerans]MBF9134770.1 TIR domain-containing protein [Plantactinospora alkalitolerans]